MDKIEGGFVLSDAAQLYYECAGAGPTIIFLHAGVADPRMWDRQFDRFSATYRVIRYDARGFGKSKGVDGPWSLRNDLRNVMSHLGINRAALIGCSMGGGTAIDFVLEHPDAVSAMVLVGSGLRGFQWGAQTAGHFTELMKLVQSGDVQRAKDLDTHFFIDGPARDSSKVDPAYRQRARELHDENFPPQIFLNPEQPLNPPAAQRLAEIKAPTQVIIGDCDAPDLLTVASHLATEIAGAKLATIKNAAHLPNMEHPDEFDRIIAEFLSQQT